MSLLFNLMFNLVWLSAVCPESEIWWRKERVQRGARNWRKECHTVWPVHTHLQVTTRNYYEWMRQEWRTLNKLKSVLTQQHGLVYNRVLCGQQATTFYFPVRNSGIFLSRRQFVIFAIIWWSELHLVFINLRWSQLLILNTRGLQRVLSALSFYECVNHAVFKLCNIGYGVNWHLYKTILNRITFNGDLNQFNLW